MSRTSGLGSLSHLPGFIQAKIHAGINAYVGICYVCKKRVEPGEGIRNTVKGPFSMIHKIRHRGCGEEG